MKIPKLNSKTKTKTSHVMTSINLKKKKPKTMQD